MRVLALFGGVICLSIVLFDAFETVILPRRASGRFRLTRIFYLLTWRPWAFVARRFRNTRRRETAFSFYGPLSLILLLGVWAAAMILGFALIYYSVGSPFRDPTHRASFLSDLYVGGTTLFTLGLGDVTPQNPAARVLMILEAGTGFGFLAVTIGYFPVLYSAFSRREVSISLLDARAGTPPTTTELMRRHAHDNADEALTVLLVEWERWSAELLESHISYPLLCYFRSQHNNQSWLSALTAILDTSALLISGIHGQEVRQAQLTFAMARHAVVDLSQIFSLWPVTDAPDRLPPERYQKFVEVLRASGVTVCSDSICRERLREVRALYEGHAEALSRYLAMPLPPWIDDRPHKDNWLTVARLRARTRHGQPPSDEGNQADDLARTISASLDQHHDF